MKDYISDTGDAEPEETLKVYQMLAELITSDVRLTIESATQGEDAISPAIPVRERKQNGSYSAAVLL
jgi:hypothetical protein